jgi:hypothetical protein
MKEVFSNYNVSILCVAIIVVAAIVSLTIHYGHQASLKAQNIESAIEKGIDPFSVRCSYASDRDMICLSYASSLNK